MYCLFLWNKRRHLVKNRALSNMDDKYEAWVKKFVGGSLIIHEYAFRKCLPLVMMCFSGWNPDF